MFFFHHLNASTFATVRFNGSSSSSSSSSVRVRVCVDGGRFQELLLSILISIPSISASTSFHRAYTLLSACRICIYIREGYLCLIMYICLLFIYIYISNKYIKKTGNQKLTGNLNTRDRISHTHTHLQVAIVVFYICEFSSVFFCFSFWESYTYITLIRHCNCICEHLST